MGLPVIITLLLPWVLYFAPFNLTHTHPPKGRNEHLISYGNKHARTCLDFDLLRKSLMGKK
ncbi:hypothetical protein HN51_041791, partial [Arachis hypogaea]